MRHQQIYAVLFLLMLCMSGMAGCKRPGPPRDVMIMALRSDPMSLNPVLASEMTSITVNAFIFNSLLRYNEKMDLTGDLAESWKASPDERTWTFRLNGHVTWHDGAPFTAEDVQFTFEKLFDPSTNTYNRGLFQIDGQNPEVRVLDPATVQFRLPRPFAPFISNLASLPIIPSHLLKDKDINRCEFNWHPVGTGPFMFREWKSSERIHLTAYKDYFRGAPRLKGVLLPVIPSAESRRIALMTGTVDISTLSTEDLRAVKEMKGIRLYQWRQFCYYYIGFDLTKPIFQNRTFRKALNYAIDKERIVRAVLQGTAETATGPIPLPSWAYSGSVEKYAYNPEKARNMLISSGWREGREHVLEKDGKRLEFELRYPSGSPACEKASVFIQAQLMEIGIKANLRSTEFSALINCCNPGQFEAVMLDWSENFDPDCFTEWHTSQIGDKGMNFMSYSNPRVDRLLEEARTHSSRAVRKALYERFQQIVADDAPYVFLWNPDYVAAVNGRVDGLPPAGPAGLFTELEKIYLR